MEEKQLVEDESRDSYFCTECGAEVAEDDKICPKCCADISEIEEEVSGEKAGTAVEPFSRIKIPKYPALNTISNIYKAIAIILGVFAGLAFLIGIATTIFSNIRNVFINVISLILFPLIFGVIGVISFLAISEIIKLFIDLESHSREQINLLKKILEKK